MQETNTYLKLKDKPKDNFPEYIVVHHSGGTQADPNADTSHHTANGMEAQHLSMGWEGLGYHYVIHKNGDVWRGRPEHYHGAHVSEQNINKKSIAICLAGNFTVVGRKPTEEQENSLANLENDIKERYVIPLDKIVPHRHFLGNPPYKDCYGDQLSDSWARNIVVNTPTISKEIILKRLAELTKLVEQL